MGTPASDAIREKVSEGFRAYTEDGMARGVTYKLGVKDGKTQIDCSGFIEKAVRQVFDGYLTKGEKLEMKGKHQTHVFDCGADDQIAEISRKTGVLLQGDKLNMKSIKEGMIIGMGSENKPAWAGDRDLWNNISHIVLVYKDPKSGELMVGQSSGTGHGVNSKPLKEWLPAAKAQGWSLYATDVAKLAENIGAQPVVDPQREALAKAVGAGEGVAKSFLSAFPDVSGAFGLKSPRAEKTQNVPGIKPTAPGSKLTH